MTAIEQRDGELLSNVETMPAETGPQRGALGKMAIGALGVVYGEPAYTFKTAIEWAAAKRRPPSRSASLRSWCGRSSSPPR
jgi:hypothetical protein